MSAQERKSSNIVDLSDDDDLQQALDLHSLIISSQQDDPVMTVDDVINEIEGMMEVLISTS